MKAQDYVDKYLPLMKEAKDDSELKSLPFKAFMEFNDEVVEIAKSRNTTRNDAVRSIIKEVSQKWGKFCRIMNAQQDRVTIKEDFFMDYWNRELNLEVR